MKNVLLALGTALVLALGGVGVANLAAGADHSGSGRHHAPEQSEQSEPSEPSKPSAPSQVGSEHSKQMRELAQTHRAGMKRWQDCHRAQRSSCVKPIPPGWAKHPDKHPGGWPPKHQGDEKKDDRG